MVKLENDSLSAAGSSIGAEAGSMRQPEPCTSTPRCPYQAQGLAISRKPWPASPYCSCSNERTSAVMESAVTGENLAPLQYLAPHLLRRAERQGLLRVHAPSPEREPIAEALLEMLRIHASCRALNPRSAT